MEGNLEKELVGEDQPSVLEARARALALQTEAKDHFSTFDVVEFVLAQERYALELKHIQEVCPLKNLTRLPWIPGYVFGIMNVRGRILSVLDLKVFFGLPETDITGHTRVVILQAPHMEFGILADDILGIRSIEKERMQTSVPMLTDKRALYVCGITPDRTVILDGAKLLSDETLIVQ